MAANESVVKYIKQASSQGHSLEQIRNALAQAGWSEQDISESIRQSSSVAPAVVAKPVVEAGLSEQEILDKQKFGFFDVLRKPKQVFAIEKNRATLQKAVKNYAVVGVIFGALLALVALLISSVLVGVLSASGTKIAAGGVVGILIAVLAFVAAVILMVLNGLIGGAVIWVACKILGGKARYDQITYLLSIYILPFMIIGVCAVIIGGILGLIPVLGWILSALISIALMVYSAYLLYAVIKEANEFSKGKAIATMILILVIYLIISLILGFALGKTIGSSITPTMFEPNLVSSAS